MTNEIQLVNIETISNEQLAQICDHTFLNRPEAYKATAKDGENPIDLRAREFQAFLEETKNLPFKPYAVCVRPEDVQNTKKFLEQNCLQNIKIASVVGFPDGSLYTREFKIEETRLAVHAGADEIDMVLNYNKLKAGKFEEVKEEINQVVYYPNYHRVKVKVILEVSELNASQIEQACKMCEETKADFVKTSTGYSSSGASAEALKIMRANFSRGVKMSGGVKADRVKELLYAASGRDDGMIELDPMKIRIGESKLLTGRTDKRQY